MATRTPHIIEIPFGKPDAFTIYISGTDFTNKLLNYKLTRRLNQMSTFEADLVGISSDDSLIKERNEVMFFTGSHLELKGILERPNYQSFGQAKIKGFGMEKILSNRFTQRKEWVDSGTDEIITELCSVNIDGASPFIMETGTVADWGDITVRSEYSNRLRVMSELAHTVGSGTKSYDWYVDQSGTDFALDRFNFVAYMGTESSVKTFNIGQEARFVNYEVDTENMGNDVTVLGYGDGVNQISGTATDATSVAKYGTFEKTFVDRALINAGVAGSLANTLLQENKNPIERIKLSVVDNSSTDVDIGDQVTVIDSNVFPTPGSVFRVVGIEKSKTRGLRRLNYELSNKSRAFTENVSNQKREIDSVGTYSKGNTNAYMTGETDNCDSTHGLRIDFFIPEESIAINDVRLNYRLFKYRIPNINTTVAKSGRASAVYTYWTDEPNTWKNIVPDDDTGSLFVIENQATKFQFPISLQVQDSNYNPSFDFIPIALRISASGTNFTQEYFPASDGVVMLLNSSVTGESGADSGFTIEAPKNLSGAHVWLEAETLGGAGSIQAATYFQWIGIGDLSVTEDASDWGVTDMEIYIDGVDKTSDIETDKGSALVVTESGTEIGTHMELSSYLVGTAGSWHHIEVKPNAKCRVVGDLYVQTFLESK